MKQRNRQDEKNSDLLQSLGTRNATDVCDKIRHVMGSTRVINVVLLDNVYLVDYRGWKNYLCVTSVALKVDRVATAGGLVRDVFIESQLAYMIPKTVCYLSRIRS
jgi:hypothetical protein